MLLEEIGSRQNGDVSAKCICNNFFLAVSTNFTQLPVDKLNVSTLLFPNFL